MGLKGLQYAGRGSGNCGLCERMGRFRRTVTVSRTLVLRVTHIAGYSPFSLTCSIAVVKGHFGTKYLINDAGCWRKPGGELLACGAGADCFWYIHRKVSKGAEIAKQRLLTTGPWRCPRKATMLITA
jgi:hypothetical protein